MRKNSIPTLLGIGIIFISLAIAVFLIGQQQKVQIGAISKPSPKNVRVSNVDSSSFIVSWTTDSRSLGAVVWGDKPNAVNKVIEQDGNSSFLHSIKIGDLSPSENYYFKIISSGVEYDSSNIPWHVKIGPKISTPPESSVVSGVILSQIGLPKSNVQVFATVGGGSLLSTTSGSDGSWLISTSHARTRDLSKYVTINDSTPVEIFVQAGPEGVSLAQVLVSNAMSIPPITLGEVYDFRNITDKLEGEVPEAEIGLPQEEIKPSKFNPEVKGVKISHIIY